MLDENINAVKLFNEMAEVYQQKYMNVDIYQEPLGYFLNKLNNSNKSILDIACGPGNMLNYIVKQNAAFNLYGLDLSEEMIRLAKLNVPAAEFELYDCRCLSSFKSTYNAILCNFLIPYLSEKETEKLISDVYNLLLPSGLLFFGFIMEETNRNEIVLSSKGHEVRMNYYSVDFIQKLFQQHHYKIEYCKEFESNNINQSQVDIIMVASKQDLLLF